MHPYIKKIKSLSITQKLGIIIALLALFIISIDSPFRERFSSPTNNEPLIKGLSAKQVYGIQIKKEGSNIKLEKKEGLWKLIGQPSFPADKEKVNELIEAIESLKKREVVSKKKSRQNLFEVDDENSTKITLIDRKNREISKFHAGKESDSHQQYFRLNESNITIKADLSIKNLINQGEENWKDKTILKADEIEAKRITIKNLSEEITLENNGGKWMIAQYNNEIADQLVVRTLFERIKNLSAEKFAEIAEGSQADFNEPDYKISVRNKNETLRVVLFKKSEEKDYYFAKNGESSFIYIVGKELIDSIFELKYREN